MNKTMILLLLACALIAGCQNLSTTAKVDMVNQDEPYIATNVQTLAAPMITGQLFIKDNALMFKDIDGWSVPLELVADSYQTIITDKDGVWFSSNKVLFNQTDVFGGYYIDKEGAPVAISTCPNNCKARISTQIGIVPEALDSWVETEKFFRKMNQK